MVSRIWVEARIGDKQCTFLGDVESEDEYRRIFRLDPEDSTEKTHFGTGTDFVSVGSPDLVLVRKDDGIQVCYVLLNVI